MKLELIEICSSCSGDVHIEFDTTKWLDGQWKRLQDTIFRKKVLCESCAGMWGAVDYSSEFKQDWNTTFRV